MDGTHIQRLRISCKASWEVRLKCSEDKNKMKKTNQNPKILNSPMMMCKADVTGSITPTVAKHTQSVEPVVGTTQHGVQRHRLSIKHFDIWQRASSLPAGMMPMCSGHGCKMTSGSFSQRPASCCVRPTTPWSTSLNMPSPPTHTTLSLEQKEASLVFSSPSPPALQTAPRGLTRQSRPGLSSGGDLWPGWPVQSLHKPTSGPSFRFNLSDFQHLSFSNTHQSRES